ncbi:short subunit dehydrogenase-like uncharacterized protein [Actinoplanes lutulentus]|uniref:Short subunit dehydrogenase-like uncharacterized protein n=1 Tax=Actinoplanes lutulentus TaxID=1287878 RepID=A0A327ZA85_9ACTN|nr:saccharopine dehydrogenase NADP-binding domain-containing protein [Actinoplanes lutulentus]MBB2943393.1 short subunit dehydrogenase-like uncharacterized protein [Actinoplanes lutulentus]RAK28451.1 short subunit dehydrogenase-like uncharacterized protein [Actinoplanes lutulentus]
MTPRIVVFGASGYTGELVSRALVARGVKPVLAGRSAEKLERLAAQLGNLETQIADVDRPKSVRALVEAGDVLIATVGPFARWGGPAVEAAIDAGAHYLDSTGEPAFIRAVFDRYGPQAASAHVALLPAFGYDWLPGNLAGALALSDAGPGARRVEIGYFSRRAGGVSGGTRASLAGAVLDRSFAFRGGRLRAERTGARVRSFRIGPQESRYGLSVGGTEHFGLPAEFPAVRDVGVFLPALAAPMIRAMPVLSLLLTGITGIGPVRNALESAVHRRVLGSSGGPSAESRAESSSVVIAEAFSESDELLQRCRLEGVNGYTFTGDILAWAATRIADGGLLDTGALAPVSAFGLPVLEAAAAESGFVRAS